MKSPLLLALALAACAPVFGVQGSGVAKSETRALAAFDKISLSGSSEALVKVGGAPGVTIHCDDNLLAHVSTRVVDGRLELSLDGGTYRLRTPLRFEVSVPRLVGASIAGSGRIDVSGVDSPSFDVSIAGSGDVQAVGRTERLAVDVAGSGDAELFALAAQTVDVEIAGSGDVQTAAARALHVEIAGSGSVRYRGEPAVTRSIAGSGEVERD